MDLDNFWCGLLQIINWINEFISTNWWAPALIIGIAMWLWKKYSEKSLSSRLAKVEQENKQPPTINVSNKLININNKPIAKFTQKFEMLDTVIPLSNAQILTFFAPKVFVEYLNGDKDAVELPSATFEEVLKALEVQIKTNPNFLKGLKPLSVSPAKLREMLKEFEDNESAD